jgi:hypothetical protein
VYAVVEPFYVYPHDTVEIFLAGSVNGSDVRDSRVIHQNVDALVPEDFVECLADLSLIRNITGISGHVSAGASNLLAGRRSVLLAEIQNANLRAVSRKLQCDGLSDAAAAAGNKSEFAR